MRSSRKISPLMMYMTLLLSIGISNHVLLIPVLLETAKRDAWIGVVAALAPTIVWVGALRVIVGTIGNCPIGEWVGRHYGKTIRFALNALAIVYFSAFAVMSLADTVYWTNTTYLPKTPKAVIASVFILVCFLAARAGMRAIAIASGLLLPVVVLLGYLVATANLQYKDYSLLTPVFTQGYVPALKAMAYTSGGVFEIVLVLFMHHHLSSSVKLRGLLVMAFLLVGLTVGPVMGAITLFGPFEAAELRYPAFEQWRMVTLGKFVSHLDFFSIYQWLAGSFAHISLMLFLIPDVLGVRRERRNGPIAVMAAALAGLMLIPFSDTALLRVITDWYFPGIAGLSVVIGLTLLALTLLAPSGERGT